MSSEIEVVDEIGSRDAPATTTEAASTSANGTVIEEDNLRNDVYTAAAYGDMEKLQRLVEFEGCSVSQPDGLGYYALQWASLNNRPVAAQYILEHGGDVNVADHTGQTALHWSSVRGSVQVAELLLQEGARVNATDMNGYQGNARRLFDKRWDGNTRLGQLSKFGLAPVLWCMIFVLLVMYVHSVIIEEVVQRESTSEGTVYVDGKGSIGVVDSDYVCATLDWWPPEKCDYGTCSWGKASLLNLDLNNEIFLKAIQAFSPLKIRLGGSLQDKLIYETEDHRQPCTPFAYKASEMFSFTKGCLPMHRWDELNLFFEKSGASIIFGLNALNGRSINVSTGTAVGNWDSTNAESFIRFTVKKNYMIHGWELGNELCGTGVGVRVAAAQYSSDTISFVNLVQDIYKGVELQPQLIAPGGFFDANWFKEYISKTPKLNVVTHHIYNLGAGVDQHLVERILDPVFLDGIADTFKQLQSIVKNSGASAWVGESGGAYNSGHDLVSNAFVYSFWYLDQLGMAATYDTKTYCRQTLIGGNYGLLDTKTFVPNPDYYSALLWHRLMGRKVLSTSFSGTRKLRAYTHCAKQSNGITMLLINLDKSTTVLVTPAFINTSSQQGRRDFQYKRSKLMQVSPGDQMHSTQTREEYHLTAKDGNLHSQTMFLNGNALTLTSSGDIPIFIPVHVNSSEPIEVIPYSIVYVHLPDVVLPACK